MIEYRKDCPKCGAENVLFGRNKNTKDGLARCCKQCKLLSHITAKQQDWKELNRKRRSNPEYRNKERERAAERDKERRKNEIGYSQKRSQDHKRYLNDPKNKEVKERRSQKQREKYKAKQDARSPEEVAAAKLRQKIGFLIWNKQISGQ